MSTPEEIDALGKMVVTVEYYAVSGNKKLLTSSIDGLVEQTIFRSKELITSCRNLPVTNISVDDKTILHHLEWFKGVEDMMQTLTANIELMKVQLKLQTLPVGGLEACVATLLKGIAEIATQQETFWTHAQGVALGSYEVDALH